VAIHDAKEILRGILTEGIMFEVAVLIDLVGIHWDKTYFAFRSEL